MACCKKMDCFNTSAGTCVSILSASATPLCPRNFQGISSNLSVTFSLGGYTFSEVFGSDTLDFKFTRAVCDGRQTQDATECTSARACDTATCMTEVTSANQEPRACPVQINPAMQGEEWKTTVACMPCSGSGEPQAHFITQAGWGEGCARECTQQLCDDAEVYDWTDSRCKPCAELWNASLCATRGDKDVAGHLHRVRFSGCHARGENDVRYESCETCPNYESECTSGSFPDAKCGCSACKRDGAFSRHYIGVLPDRNMCTRKDRVMSDGTICKTPCKSTACNGGERVVPCTLPRDTRCASVFPRGVGKTPADITNASSNIHYTLIVACDSGRATKASQIVIVWA